MMGDGRRNGGMGINILGSLLVATVSSESVRIGIGFYGGFEDESG